MASQYQAYPEYKYSEIEWLGEVPSHWIVSKFGYVKTVLTDYTANGSFAGLKKNVVYHDEPSYARLVRLTDLRVNLDNENGVWIDKDAYNYLKKSALFGGEFLLANVGAYAGLFYQMPENKGPASLAPNMFMAKFDANKVLREFMAYVGQSQSANEQLKLNATASSAQPKLNKDDFKSVRFAFPPYEEQNNIAAFLDHETARIDTLIEKQQRLIELLNEKRQAVISHAVTKGLNPDAPMRDSGVEWLGEVPEHWDMVPLKYISQIRYGIGEPPEYQEEGVPLIRATNIRSGEISNVNLVLVDPNDIPENKIVWLDSGDIIVVRSGAGTGDSSIIPSQYQGSIAGFDMIVKPIKCVPEFLGHVLLSNYVRYNQIDLEKTRAAQPHLNAEELGGCFILLPADTEQQEILAYINDEISKIDCVMRRTMDAATLLMERRTALISAAVTGKIDVRNWSPDAQ